MAAWLAGQSHGEVCLVGRSGRAPSAATFAPLTSLADTACLTLTRADVSCLEETAGCMHGDRRAPIQAIIHAGKPHLLLYIQAWHSTLHILRTGGLRKRKKVRLHLHGHKQQQCTKPYFIRVHA